MYISGCGLLLYSLLASGSDDLEIKIWNIYEKRLVASMNSGHTGNIFSTKVL